MSKLYEVKRKPWMGSFRADTDEEAVTKQLIHNCKHWGGHICKRETAEKYCQEKGIMQVHDIINNLLRTGVLYEPKPGYVGFSEPTKHGLI